MQSLIIIQRFIEQFLSERSAHPVAFWIVALINAAVGFLILLIQIDRVIKQWRGSSLFERALSIISAVISVFFLPLIIIMIACSGTVVETTDLFNNQFFTEIIIISLGLVLLKTIKLRYDYGYLQTDEDSEIDDDDDEDSDEAILAKSILLIIISAIFLFTDLENGLITWGFSLFGHDLGAWIFGLYAAWSGAAIIRFVEAAIVFMSEYSQYVVACGKKYLYESIACLLLVVFALAGVYYLSGGVLKDRPAINMAEGEGDFVFAKEAKDGTEYTSEDIDIEGEKEFWILTSIHNNDPDRSVTAENVHLNISITQTEHNESTVTADLSSSNAKPRKQSDSFTFTSSEDFHLEYVPGSTYMYSHFDTGQQTIAADGDAVSEEGISVGYDSPDGNIPGGEFVTVSIKVKVVKEN